MHNITFGLLPMSQEPPNSLVDKSYKQRTGALARSLRRGRFFFLLAVVLAILFLSFYLTQAFPFSFLIDIVIFIKINVPFLLWQPVVGWLPMLVFVGLILVSVLVLAFYLPFFWYTDFAIPRRYGLRKGTTLAWLRTTSKSVLFIFVQIWLFIELCTLLFVVQPQTWWAWVALAQFFYSLLLNRFGSRWLLPWLNKITLQQEGELNERLRVLLVRLHLPECKLYQVSVSYKTAAANAYFVGWGSGRRILLTDTLVQHFTLDEIEVILAHELGHLVHHDIWTRIVMRSLISLGLLYFLYLDVTDGSWLNNVFTSLPVLQPFTPVLALIFFLALLSLTMYYQRFQEYQADDFALQTTGKIQAFKTAMTKLTNMNKLTTTAKRRFKLPASHPTLQKRLQHADAFALLHGSSLSSLV